MMITMAMVMANADDTHNDVNNDGHNVYDDYNAGDNDTGEE